MTETKENGIITISWPNEDGRIDLYTYCPQTVVIQAYIDSIGRTISYLGIQVKVLSVKITETHIYMELKEISLE
jgi:hypothetical protein